MFILIYIHSDTFFLCVIITGQYINVKIPSLVCDQYSIDLFAVLISENDYSNMQILWIKLCY